MKRIAIFVDVQNIYYTTRDAYGRQFNYRKFWQQLELKGEIVTANAYAIARNDDSQIKFQDALKHIGFEVKLKPYIQRKDGSAKGDWDVGITIDAMDYSEQADNVVLVSGDGDFDLLVNKLRIEKNKFVEVYGVPALTAASLMNAASEFIPIDGDLLLK